jgi:N4-gp56 family major capsid protein
MAVGRKADYTASIPQIWSDGLFSQAENMTFFNGMEGPEGSSMPIIRKDQLGQQAGDTVKTDLVLALTGAGLTGDTAGSLLEGNEEALKFRQLAFTVDSLQHAVRWTKLAQKQITHDMRRTAQNQLAKWLAGKLDDQIFAELSGAGSTTMPTTAQWFAGTATSRDTIADTDAGGRLTLNTLTELKAFAQVENKIEPIRTEDGNEYFTFVAHPYAVMQLKRDDAKWAQAQREAQVSGDENPLFTGSAGIWDGVIIRSSNRVRRSNNAATTPVPVADNLFLGAQAMIRGYGSYPDWTEEYFSYGQEAGIATWTLVGNKLAVFDLTAAGGAAATAHTAIGSMVVYTAAVAPTA